MPVATDSPEPCFDSSDVRVYERRWRWALLSLLFSALLAFVLELPYLFWLAVGAGLGLDVLRRVRGARWSRPGPGRVLSGENQLQLERDGRRYRIDPARITDCWQQLDHERGVTRVFAVTGRALISVVAPDAASAEALCRALGTNPETGLAGTTLSAHAKLPALAFDRSLRRYVLYYGTYVFLAIAPLLAINLMVRLNLSALLMPLLILPWMFLTLRMTFRNLVPSRVQVGRDGLLVTTPDRREFFGFERLRRVRENAFGIELLLKDGEVVGLPLAKRFPRLLGGKNPVDAWVSDPEQVLARRGMLARQLGEALERFRSAGEDANAATTARVLDRANRPLSEWRKALSHAHAETYREQGLGVGDLVGVLENPRLPVSQRLGAALALADRTGTAAPAPEHRVRIRAAVASSANPRVRIALERAAEGTLDESSYDRALAAEAEAQRDARVRRVVKA